ncbi:outer membrane beta-barrel protein [bacterium]|nr:outer membrane beta-barrel protein [bacterium]
MFKKILGRKGTLVLITLLSFLLNSGSLYARKLYVRKVRGIKLGDFILHPGLTIEGMHDDNVFLTSSNKKDDFLTTFTPSLSLEIPFRNYHFEMDYSLNILKYSEYPSQDADNHILKGALDLSFRDFEINIKNDFKDTFDRADTEFMDRVRYSQNDLKGEISFSFPRLETVFKIQNIRHNHYKKIWSAEDRTENIYTFRMNYRFLPKTAFLMEYNHGEIRYDTALINPESDYREGMVGVVGKLTSKCESTIKVGYQNRKYKVILDPPDFDTIVTDINIKERFNSRNTLNLSFLRKAMESTFTPNAYYQMNKVWLKYEYKLNRKLFSEVVGSYQLNQYPEETTIGTLTEEREDVLTSAGINLKYKLLRWLFLNIGYQHEERDSNFDIFNYRDNKTSLNLTALY